MSHAFTLIEMILAIGVAAIVLSAANAVFFTALHLRDATSDAVDAATPVDQSLTMLRRDLQCAVPPKASGVLSGDFKIGNVTSTGISDPVAAEIYTADRRVERKRAVGRHPARDLRIEKFNDRQRRARICIAASRGIF